MSKQQKPKILSSYLLIFFLISDVTDKHNLHAMDIVLTKTTVEGLAQLATYAIAYILLENTRTSALDKHKANWINSISQDKTTEASIGTATSTNCVLDTMRFATVDDISKSELSSNITTTITKEGLPSIKFESANGWHGGLKALSKKALARLMPLSSREQREFAERTIPAVGEALDLKVALLNKLISQLLENNKEVNNAAIPELNLRALVGIYKLNFKGHSLEKELEQIKYLVLALHANENGRIAHLSGRDNNYLPGLKYCAQEILKLDRKVHYILYKSNRLSKTDIEAEYLYAISSNINVAARSNCAPGKMSNKQIIAKIRSKEIFYNKFLDRYISQRIVTAPNPNVDGQVEMYKMMVSERCKELGIDETCYTWYDLKNKHRVLNQSNHPYSQLVIKKCKLEQILKQEYLKKFNISPKEANCGKFKKFFKDLLLISVDETKTTADINKFLMDVATGKKHPKAKKYITLPNGILKCYLNNAFATRITIDTLPLELQERAIIAANNLCSACTSPDNYKFTTSISAGLRALEHTNVIPPEEAILFAESITKALNGEAFYKPLLEETKYWPMALRPNGIKQADKDFVAEFAEQAKMHETLNDGEVWIIEDTIFFNQQKNKYEIERRIIKSTEGDKLQKGGGNKPPKDPKENAEHAKRAAEEELSDEAKKTIEEAQRQIIADTYFAVVREEVETLNALFKAKGFDIYIDKDTIRHVVFGDVRKGALTGCHFLELDPVLPSFIDDKIRVNKFINKIVKRSFGKYGGIMDLASKNGDYKSLKPKTYFGMTPKQLLKEMIVAVENDKIKQGKSQRNCDSFIVTLRTGMETELQSTKVGNIETLFAKYSSLTKLSKD